MVRSTVRGKLATLHVLEKRKLTTRSHSKPSSRHCFIFNQQKYSCRRNISCWKKKLWIKTAVFTSLRPSSRLIKAQASYLWSRRRGVRLAVSLHFSGDAHTFSQTSPVLLYFSTLVVIGNPWWFLELFPCAGHFHHFPPSLIMNSLPQISLYEPVCFIWVIPLGCISKDGITKSESVNPFIVLITNCQLHLRNAMLALVWIFYAESHTMGFVSLIYFYKPNVDMPQLLMFFISSIMVWAVLFYAMCKTIK